MKRIIFAGIVITVVGLAGFMVWQKFYLCDEICRELIVDTNGGVTSQATIDLFVDALKQEDVELASSYFVISEREKWVKTLQIFKDNGFLDEMVADIEGDPNLVELKFNEYSKVWKIANFQ